MYTSRLHGKVSHVLAKKTYFTKLTPSLGKKKLQKKIMIRSKDRPSIS